MVQALPIRIVLVEPAHPGNIGAAARAMKNMGLADLWLVAPRQYPHAEATALAAGAADLLDSAHLVGDVATAVAGCGFVIGTSARARTQYPWPILPAREAAARLVAEAAAAPVAVLFGPERTGLTNEHLELCHALLQVPTNPDYGSINLAQAVLLVGYELRMAVGAALPAPPRESPLPPVEQLEHLYAHFARVMVESGFETHGEAAHVGRRLRRLLHRAVPEQQEVNLLRGFLGAVSAALARVPATPADPATAAPLLPYFDHAATTPLHPAALAAMEAAWRGAPANAAARAHRPGRAAAQALEAARAAVAAAIGAPPASIVFTSGATEADNLAVLGAARGNAARGRHVLTARTEHRAVLDACAQLAREGFEVQYLPTDAAGCVTAEAVAAALRPDTVLVSLMLVNNETGVIQDLAGIAAVCRPRGVLVHTDAAQALGRVPVEVAALDVDLLSLSAHKCGGPGGIGALFVRREPRPTLAPLLHGGGHEGGLRPGTPPLALAAGFAAAAHAAAGDLPAEAARLAALRDGLEAHLANVPGLTLNAAGAPRSPSITSATVDGVDGESLLFMLEPFAVASGAACSSVTREPSAVLRALGHDEARAEATLRISLGRTTRSAEVDALAAQVPLVVMRLRALAAGSAGPATPRQAVSQAAAQAALAPLAAVPAGEAGQYSARVRHWVAAPLRAEADFAIPVPAALGEAAEPASRTRVCFLVAADGAGGVRVRWRARGCPHVLAAAEVAAEALERELVARSRAPSMGEGAGAGHAQPAWPDVRAFAAAVDAPTEKLGRLLAVLEAAAAARSRYTSPEAA